MLGHHQPTTWATRTLVVAVGLCLSGCASGASFVADDRVDMIRPAENAEVGLPFEVAWTADDVDGSFAVFFDRSPLARGRSLASLVDEDDPCREVAGCPDANWLAERHIYVTDGSRVRVEQLPDLRSNNHAKDRHYLTVILLDENGERVGESAFTTEFVVERR